MEWRDTGILLATRKHGETSLILDVFTPGQGRHAGVLRGGTSRKMAPMLQPGAQLDLTWRARLEDHMGAFTAEPQRSRAAAAMGDRLSLAGLSAVLALVRFCLPERAAYPALYARTETLLDLLGQPELWPLAYLRWERALLAEMGFGLDLSACAVTGATEGLAFVSPRTGRAVTATGAGDWADRLLPLPPVLLGEGAAEDAEILQALAVTGHFLEHAVAPDLGQDSLPPARAAFLDRLRQRAFPAR
jgi:DNA repair protein RecO (recombination protein O)